MVANSQHGPLSPWLHPGRSLHHDLQWQRNAGLLDASTFDSVLTVTRGIFALPGVRICWQMILPRVSVADSALVETLLLKDQPSITASDLTANWTALAAQMYPPGAD